MTLARRLLPAVSCGLLALSSAAVEGPIALLPPENLSGTAAPLDRVQAALAEAFSRRGIELLDPGLLEAFMARHRVRWTGGLASDTARALREETGAAAAVVSSLDLYVESEPPAVALTARLVAAEADPRILWMDGNAAAGDDAPGLLGLGLVSDAGALLESAASALAASLERALLATEPPPMPRVRGPHRPRRIYRAPGGLASPQAVPRIAVLPCLDRTGRRHAGDLVSLGLVLWLASHPHARVIEPGVVRSALLGSMLIPAGGISLPQGDLLRLLLGADLVVSGEVFDYQDRPSGGGGAPLVNFAVTLLDTARRQVVWSSISHASGDEGVFLFDRGRIRTAHALASAMALGVVEAMLGQRGRSRVPEQARAGGRR